MVDEIMTTDDTDMLAYWSKRYPEKAATEIKRLRREVEEWKNRCTALVQAKQNANQRIEELEGALRDCIHQIRRDERRFSEEKFGINWMDAAEDCQITLSKHAHLIGGEDGDT